MAVAPLQGRHRTRLTGRPRGFLPDRTVGISVTLVTARATRLCGFGRWPEFAAPVACRRRRDDKVVEIAISHSPRSLGHCDAARAEDPPMQHPADYSGPPSGDARHPDRAPLPGYRVVLANNATQALM